MGRGPCRSSVAVFLFVITTLGYKLHDDCIAERNREPERFRKLSLVTMLDCAALGFDGSNLSFIRAHLEKQTLQNFASRRISCSRQGFRFYEVFVDGRKLMKKGLSVGQCPLLSIGMCVPRLCEMPTVFKHFWRKYMKEALGSEKELQWPLCGREAVCLETTTLKSGLVRLLERGHRVRSTPVLVPAMLLAVAAEPASFLRSLYNSAGGQAMQLDFSVMPDVGADKKFALPPRVSSIIIDVGSHERTEFAERMRGDPHVLVICIEPLPEANEKHRQWLELQEARVREQMWLLPIAVGREVKISLLHVSNESQCSSLLPFNEDALTIPGYQACVTEVEQIAVLQVPLAAILSHLPRVVDLLKVDAQGMDLEVVLSAGETLKRVKRIQVEVQDISSRREERVLRYRGQPSKSDVVKQLGEAGFALEGCTPNSYEIDEHDCTFQNRERIR